MPHTPTIWTEAYRVRAYETDPHGHASLPTLCNYFQEAAGLHAAALGVAIDDLQRDGLTWVLSRLRVEIDRAPRRGENVWIETWPAGIDDLSAARDFFVLGERAGEPVVLGRGISTWLVVDQARKRPVRLPPALHEIPLAQRERALDGDFSRLAPSTASDGARRFDVRYGDLDVNRHVNNVRYAEWVVESVPDAMLHTHTPNALELHFRAETTMGDHIMAHALPDGDGAFVHRLVRGSDGRDVARARTRWRLRPAD